MRSLVITISAVASLAAAPTTAVAETPNQGGYSAIPIVVPPGSNQSPPGGIEVKGETVSSAPGSVAGATSPGGGTAPAVASATPSAAAPGGSLPFTGLDLGVIVLLAAALLGLGLFLRRVSRPQGI